MKLFRRTQKAESNSELYYKEEYLKKVKKKNRKKALKLLEEYKKGLIIKVDKDINQKQLMEQIRKGN